MKEEAVSLKLVFAVVQNDDVKALTRALIDHEISVTRISSTGGFLRGGNTTLMIGVEEERLETVLSDIKEKSSRRQTVTVPATSLPNPVGSAAIPVQIMIGGATVFIVTVEQFVKY